MSESEHYIGQRLSLKSQAFTVRYVGEVHGRSGQWLGVEWDDRERGKHNGNHEGTQYFTCRSSSATAASFLRPKQEWDKTRSFLDALSEKYFRTEDAHTEDVVFVSRSKQIEEVGFEKFAQRQAELRGIHVLVLDAMQMRHAETDSDNAAISTICANITDLDIGRNLFETFGEILSLCSHLPKLRRLTIDGNRFILSSGDVQRQQLEGIREVSFSNTLLSSSDIVSCLAAFPQMSEFHSAANNLSIWVSDDLPPGINSINLSNNQFQWLEQLGPLLKLNTLSTLVLKHNQIKRISETVSWAPPLLSASLQEIDLSHNDISSWQVCDAIPFAFPALLHLRISGNPLYSSLLSADQQPLTPADGYVLTIARLPKLESLNYSTITDQARLNAEKYYQGQIAVELSRSPESAEAAVLSQHPRWKALCDEYGEPIITRINAKDSIDPNSLAARLVSIEFQLADHILPHIPVRSWVCEVPRAFHVYALYGIVGKRLQQMPLVLRLIWQTGERDPVASTSKEAEYWDSSDEEEVDNDAQWTLREVELVPGTRHIGTYLEGRRATVRVELNTSVLEE